MLNEAHKIAEKLGIKIDFPIVLGFFLHEGETFWQEVDGQIKIIKINIDKSDKLVALRALRHEIRHVWQIRSNLFNPKKKTWKGKIDTSPYGAEAWERDCKNFEKLVDKANTIQ